MDPGKSNTLLSNIEEEMNFTLSKLQSTEIKESIHIKESNILPQIKNSTEIKPLDSNFKKAGAENHENDPEGIKSSDKQIPKEKPSDNENPYKKNESLAQNPLNTMLIINNSRIPNEKSVTISPAKEESKLNSERVEEQEAKSLGKYLNIVKKNRKQVNLEAQILANRIALLKQEELKTLKKIKETKKKADEIYHIKKQNHEKNLERENQLRQTRESLTNKILDKKFLREQGKEEKDSFRITFQRQKQAETASIKRESERNQNLKQIYEKKMMESNLAKANFVKKQLLIGNLKVEEFRTGKMLRVKKEYERKISEEKIQTKKSEMDIMEMEKMELELIKKLQQSQYIQKTVYEELEGALTLPLLEFENKYKKADFVTEHAEKARKKKKKGKKKSLVGKLKPLSSFKF